MTRFIRPILTAALLSVAAACSAPSATATPSPDAGTPTVTGTVTPVVQPTITPVPPTAVAARWVPAGNMRHARSQFQSVLLGNGGVLVVGDDNICTPGGAWPESVNTESYDPSTNGWRSIASLDRPRDGFLAFRLGSGQVLVVGGATELWEAYSGPRLYDPTADKWLRTALMNEARYSPAGALLSDGRVLAAGGFFTDGLTQGSLLSSAELFDPTLGTWATTGSMHVARYGASALLLRDGTVLVVGGRDQSGVLSTAAEVYEPAKGTWTLVAPLSGARDGFSLTLLSDGTALLAGGTRGADIGHPSEILASAERFDSRTGRWSPAGTMKARRTNHVAALLPNGRVLVAGGASVTDNSHPPAPLASAELFDPSTNAWSATVPMSAPRERGQALVLNDGSVLVVGGDGGLQPPPSAPWCPLPIAAAERYLPERP